MGQLVSYSLIEAATKQNQLLRYEAAKLIAARTSLEGKLSESEESPDTQLESELNETISRVAEVKATILGNADQLKIAGELHLETLNPKECARFRENLLTCCTSLRADI